jgi:hypothetical protein
MDPPDESSGGGIVIHWIWSVWIRGGCNPSVWILVMDRMDPLDRCERLPWSAAPVE